MQVDVLSLATFCSGLPVSVFVALVGHAVEPAFSTFGLYLSYMVAQVTFVCPGLLDV